MRSPDGAFHKKILVENADEFQELWYEAVAVLEKAIKLLQHPRELGVVSAQYLPYATILPTLAALQAVIGELPSDQRLDAQRKIRCWYWSSIFTNRYSGAGEYYGARDYQDVKLWFDDDAQIPGVVINCRRQVNSDELELAQSRRGNALYNGVFNLLIIRGARDWISGSSPQHDDLDDHHIVPKSWGSKNTLQTPIDSILNRTPLTRETNRNIIKNELPNVYLRKLAEANSESVVIDIAAAAAAEAEITFHCCHGRTTLAHPDVCAQSCIQA